MNYFNKINFVADTYDGLLATLKGMTKDKLGDAYEDFSNDDVATLIQEWLAFVGASLSFSSDIKLSDNIVELTRSLKVLTILAESEGLKLSGRSPQTVEILVKSNINTVIPAGSIVRTSSGNFITSSSVNVPVYDGTDNTIKSVSAFEGVRQTITIQSNGKPFEKFDLSSGGIDIGQSIVYNSVELVFAGRNDNNWREVDYFKYNIEYEKEADGIDKLTASQVFTVDYINNNLKFGDNITGVIPEAGNIEISFYVTRGADINVPQLKNGDVSAIIDGFSEEELIGITIIGNSQGKGASIGDLNLERIKELYKGYKFSRQSCLTLSDFENFAKRCICNSGRVSIAKAYVWREVIENAVITETEREMSILFDTFIEKLRQTQQRLQDDIKVFKNEIFKLKTFLAYMKTLASKLDTQLDDLQSSYKTSLELTKSAISACKTNGKTNEIDLKVTNDFYYDFSSEKSIMDDAFSVFNITVLAFDKLTDIEGRTINDYITLISELEEKFKIDIDETLTNRYKSDINRLFNNLNNEINNLLYSPETASVINLVVLIEDNNGNYIKASNVLLQELYMAFLGNYDPSVLLHIQDGYGSIIDNALKIKVKLKEVDIGYSKEIIKIKVKRYLSDNYNRLLFGQGLTVYEVINDIETNVSGVRKAGVQLIDKTDQLVIDDYGDLDMGSMSDKLIQNIEIEVS